MKTWIRSLFAVLMLATAVPAMAELKVATSLTDLASVAQFVGGKHVTAFSLCKGYEDPHFVPAKPSLMKKVQDADLFISVGLELDGGWIPLVIPGSRNPKIQPGSKGFMDASEGIEVLEKPTGTVSRAEGDIHPLGNPHYYTDPKNLEIVADHLAKVLAELDPANASDYQANAVAFDKRMETALQGWKEKLKPFRGSYVASYHRNFDYFVERFDLKLAGTVEIKPGIPPSARHLAETAERMKSLGAKVVVYATYNDADASQDLAKKAGGVALEIPFEVDATPEAKDVFSKFDAIVSALAKNL
ncbi:MAG TPA: metal ABC transporter substrate-binding protein [bacterium]|nr:metal ABC transporter substrate-binding protein [bacterium]